MITSSTIDMTIAPQDLADERVAAYLAVPDTQVQGAIIVIHEIRGMQDHYRDVADRFVALGYAAIAPDVLPARGRRRSSPGSDPLLRSCAGGGQLAHIPAPVLAFYGSLDEPLLATLLRLEADAAAAGVDFRSVVYDGARHAFFNDTNPTTFDEPSAVDSWRRGIAVLEEHLGSTAPSR